MKKSMFLFGCLMGLVYLPTAAALSCGEGIYRSIILTSDLDCPGAARALHVMADNVTIDMNGFDISGNGSAGAHIGITVRGFDNFRLRGRGGVIRDFGNAVQIYDSDNSTVEGVAFYDNDISLLVKADFESVTNVYVYNNDFIFDETSISANNSSRRFDTDLSNISIWNNTVYFSRRGISLCRSENSLIMDNLVWGTETYGIQVRKGRSVDVWSNRLYDFAGRGITLDLTSLSQVQGNRVEFGDVGIQVDEAERYVSDTCGEDSVSGTVTNAFNTITYNSLFNNETAVVVGKPWTPNPTRADFNVIERNKIYDNELGILFHINTKQNSARNNAFTGTLRNIEDDGVRNRY